MARLIHRPSDVAKSPTVGLTATFAGESRGNGGTSSPASMALPSDSAIAQAPTLMSDTSTTEASPVRSLANSAAEIPPAIAIPPVESPYAPAGIPITRGLSLGVVPHALPIRDQ